VEAEGEEESGFAGWVFDRQQSGSLIQASHAFHENRLDEAIALLTPFREDEEHPRSSKIDIACRRETKTIMANKALLIP